jgi:hypothetical protein
MRDDILLSRDAFREAVFARDGHRCIACGEPAQDAHHVMERRLFTNGGYFLANGASVCGGCHILAEQTVLSCEEIREKAGISRVVLPEHLYDDVRYDKWANIILEDGRRLRGELFEDESVQKVLGEGGVLPLFSARVKYPRTHHLSFSPGCTDDDRILPDLGPLLAQDEWVVTEKMDGENTTFYCDGLHARSLDYDPHASRNRIKALWAEVGHNIPDGWRVCGENVYALHSIPYHGLSGYFLVYSVWTERNVALSWDETVEWAELLGLPTVPVLYRGAPDERKLREIAASLDLRRQEGFVVRPAAGFAFRDFRRVVAKWVSSEFKAEVNKSGHHWKAKPVVPNRLSAETEAA